MSTPSMISRSRFIEEQQIQPTHSPTLRIKHPIDLEDNKQDDNETTLEKKYVITPIQRSQSSSKERIDNKVFSIGSRVFVNTSHTLFNKAGIIRFIGKLDTLEGILYGIELEEAVGKEKKISIILIFFL